METRTVLKKLKSTVQRPNSGGTIDLVWDGAFVRLEFNSSCISALPFCKGMCCRQRSGYAVELEEDELDKFEHKEHPHRPGVQILQTKAGGLDCFYLDSKTSMCTVHRDKPKMCQAWHCSPGGEKDDEKITRRDAGWLLMPMRKEEAELVQLNLGGK